MTEEINLDDYDLTGIHFCFRGQRLTPQEKKEQYKKAIQSGFIKPPLKKKPLTQNVTKVRD